MCHLSHHLLNIHVSFSSPLTHKAAPPFFSIFGYCLCPSLIYGRLTWHFPSGLHVNAVVQALLLYLCKSNNTNWISYGKCSDKGSNPIDSPSIYNVYGDNMLMYCLQLLTTMSVLKIRVLSVVFFISVLSCHSSIDIVSSHLIF